MNKIQSFVCNECNQVVLIELMSNRKHNVCIDCKNAIDMYNGYINKYDKKARNKSIKESQLCLGIITDIRVKTVNNTVVTQLAMF